MIKGRDVPRRRRRGRWVISRRTAEPRAPRPSGGREEGGEKVAGKAKWIGDLQR